MQPPPCPGSVLLRLAIKRLSSIKKSRGTPAPTLALAARAGGDVQHAVGQMLNGSDGFLFCPAPPSVAKRTLHRRNTDPAIFRDCTWRRSFLLHHLHRTDKTRFKKSTAPVNLPKRYFIEAQQLVKDD